MDLDLVFKTLREAAECIQHGRVPPLSWKMLADAGDDPVATACRGAPAHLLHELLGSVGRVREAIVLHAACPRVTAGHPSPCGYCLTCKRMAIAMPGVTTDEIMNAALSAAFSRLS